MKNEILGNSVDVLQQSLQELENDVFSKLESMQKELNAREIIISKLHNDITDRDNQIKELQCKLTNMSNGDKAKKSKAVLEPITQPLDFVDEEISKEISLSINDLKSLVSSKNG